MPSNPGRCFHRSLRQSRQRAKGCRAYEACRCHNVFHQSDQARGQLRIAFEIDSSDWHSKLWRIPAGSCSVRRIIFRVETCHISKCCADPEKREDSQGYLSCSPVRSLSAALGLVCIHVPPVPQCLTVGLGSRFGIGFFLCQLDGHSGRIRLWCCSLT